MAHRSPYSHQIRIRKLPHVARLHRAEPFRLADKAVGSCRECDRRTEGMGVRRRLVARRCRLQADPLRHPGRSRGDATVDRGVRDRNAAGAGALRHVPRSEGSDDRLLPRGQRVVRIEMEHDLVEVESGDQLTMAELRRFALHIAVVDRLQRVGNPAYIGVPQSRPRLGVPSIQHCLCCPGGAGKDGAAWRSPARLPTGMGLACVPASMKGTPPPFLSGRASSGMTVD